MKRYLCIFILYITLSITSGAAVSAAPVEMSHAVPQTRQELFSRKRLVHYAVFNAPDGDALETVRRCWKAEMEELSMLRDFLRKNPGSDISGTVWGGYFPYPRPLAHMNRKAAWEEIRKILKENLEEYKKICQETGDPALMLRALDLEVLYKYLASGRTGEEIREACRGKMEYLVKQGFTLYPRMQLCEYLAEAIRQNPDEDIAGTAAKLRLARTYPYEYLWGKPELPENLKLLCFSEAGSGNFRWLAEKAGEIRKMTYRMITNQTAYNSLNMVGESLYAAEEEDPAAQEAIRELNAAFRIKKTVHPGTYPLASCMLNGKVYILRIRFAEEKDGAELHKLSLHEYDPVKGSQRECPFPDWTYEDFQPRKDLTGQPEPCSLSGSGDWIFAGGGGTLLACNTKTGKTHEIRNLPGQYPACVFFHSGKFYILCGGLAGKSGTEHLLSMYSCNPDGSEMKTLFDSKGGKSPGRVRTGRISGFFPAPDGTYWFSIHSRNHFSKIYSFRPETGAFKETAVLPGHLDILHLRSHKKGLFGQGGSIFFYLPFASPSEIVYLFTQTAENERKVNCRLKGIASVQMPAVLLDSFLFSAGGGHPLCINLKEPEKSPMLLLPKAENVFLLPERKGVVFLSSRGNLYEVYPIPGKEN